MNRQRILLTGASGCIGHYLAAALIAETEHEIFLLVRNPQKLKIDTSKRLGITVLQGNLLEIEQFTELLKTIDIAILAATAWGDPEITYRTNVIKTLELVDLLNLGVCQHIIYFSTASILGKDNQLLAEAGTIGTDYIRTKYECFVRLQKLAIAAKITTVFPTLVFGGDGEKPYSHLSAGLPEITKWINLVRWFKADGSCHFIHARDIAQVVTYLVANPPENSAQLVLGNEPLTVDQAIRQICAYLGKTIYLQIPLSIWLANFFISVFRIQMAEWDRFCLNYRHFTYQKYVNPQTFKLTPYCPTLKDILDRELGIR